MKTPNIISVSKRGFKDLCTRTFELRVRGKLFQGFVIRKEGKFYAYQNLCKHLPITLDLGDNNLLTHDKAHLQCHMHGAIYEIESGLCTLGPCEGARLRALELKEEETRIMIKLPTEEI